MKNLILTIELLLCEGSFGLHCFARNLRFLLRRKTAPDERMQTSPQLIRRQALAEQRIYLRTKLREYPRWALGHIRLGLAEISLQSMSDEPPSPRMLATVRCSFLAASALAGSVSPQSGAGAAPRGRVLLESEYLRAMLEFLGKRYEEALNILAGILLPETAVQLSQAVHFAALENAGAAALALGLKDKAEKFFNEIPPAKRSAEALSAMRYLTVN